MLSKHHIISMRIYSMWLLFTVFNKVNVFLSTQTNWTVLFYCVCSGTESEALQ